MAPLLMFIPERGIGPGRFAELELAPLLDGRQQTIEIDRGPGDLAGTLVGWASMDAGTIVKYQPPVQTWREVRDEKGAPRGYWLGHFTGRAPGPDFFAREEPIPSGLVELGDGHHWLVPIARHVPQSWGRGGRRVVLPAFEAFCEATERFYHWARTVDPVAGAAAPAETWDFLCQALALNYRLTEDVVEHLGLLTNLTWLPAVFCTMEFDLVKAIEHQKKTASAATPATSRIS